jgi:DnaJ family protein C protein 2
LTPLETTTVLSGGNAFLDYELRRLQLRSIRHGSSFLTTDDDDDDDDASASSEQDEDGSDENDNERERDLLSLSPLELEALNFYEILEIPVHSSSFSSSQRTIKKAYHKACLLYHPDKTGRSEEDAVFLTIKAAFDTLSDDEKRTAYDSTCLPFDDAIPSGNEPPEEFYRVYGPVFEANLRFDARLRRPGRRSSSSASHDTRSQPAPQPPPVLLLGNDETPIDRVHAFYEYWIHFESWRDFTLRASEETEHDVETADSRCEKRWMQREISRRARAMKRREVARVALLVERSMAADPRLARERARVEREKERRKRVQHEAQRKQEEAKRRERELLKLAREREEEEEREKRAAEKAIREGEKKLLRKTRQAFRKLVMNAYDTTTTCTADNDYTSVWKNLEEMNDDLELLCSKLTQVQLSKMTQELEKLITDTSATVMLEQVKHHAAQTRSGISQEDIEAQRQREEARAAVEKKAAQQKANRAPAPWTKEELSTLAKAIKKYPAGGANRWETITLFINNICKPDTPRTKEECIEKYNQIAKQTSGGGTAAASANGDTSTTTATSDVWTEEQDQQLQDGLKQFPGTMDKNERWTAIAKGVHGKSKKECVQRFKAIRAALKNK